jgi:hypothetical protein
MSVAIAPLQTDHQAVADESQLPTLYQLSPSRSQTGVLSGRPSPSVPYGTIRQGDGAIGIYLSERTVCPSRSKEKSIGAIAQSHCSPTTVRNFAATGCPGGVGCGGIHLVERSRTRIGQLAPIAQSARLTEIALNPVRTRIESRARLEGGIPPTGRAQSIGAGNCGGRLN